MMEVFVHTSDPQTVSAEEIHDAIEALGYYVENVTVVDRGE